MADKAVSELIEASEVTASDLFVLEQAGTAKKLSGQTLTSFLLKLVEGHGGITGIAKTKTSGLVDTYTITMADESTTSFAVTNGAKGDKGDNSYTWIKYSSTMPTKNSDIYDTPDNYLGIYTGSSSTAPTSYSSYKWFQIKGAKGDTGAAASLISQTVKYQVSANGNVIPDGAWLNAIPTVPQGQYLWTQSMLQFNTGVAQVSYSVTRFGMDGTGAVSTVAGISPDDSGNVSLTASDVGARPSWWVPSAADVGARPVTWTPTASEVGAIPNTNGAVTAEKIASGAVSSTYTATIPASGWTGSAAPYTNTVTVSGILAADNPLVDLVASSTFATAQAEIEAWGYVYKAVTAANKVTFYATEKPAVSVNVQLKAVRK